MAISQLSSLGQGAAVEMPLGIGLCDNGVILAGVKGLAHLGDDFLRLGALKTAACQPVVKVVDREVPALYHKVAILLNDMGKDKESSIPSERERLIVSSGTPATSAVHCSPSGRG